ncbi:MAG: hypothetical protein FWF35_00350 [Elusimicrobia bacterium]|nr:hypothetical protein [Elusimicrobiota bacterium]
MTKDITLEKFNHPFTQPAYWQDFEKMCKDFVDIVWPDEIQRAVINEKRKQDGVDIYKTLSSGKIIGLQCKKIEIDRDEPLTPAAIDKEIELAKNFKPALSHYVIVTSVHVSDTTIEYLKLKGEELKKQNIFSLELWGPRKLKDLINSNDSILRKYFKELLIERGVNISFAVDLFKDIKSPTVALKKIEEMAKNSWDKTDNQGKAKILNQWAMSLFAIGDHIGSANKILESYKYESNNEAALSNMTTAYYLLKDSDKMIEFANKTLEKNPLNINANNLVLNYNLSKTKDIAKVVSKLTPSLLEDISIATTISQAYIEQRKYKQTQEHLDKAKNNLDKETYLQLKVQFLVTELEAAKINPAFIVRVKQEKDFSKLSEIREKLLRIWNALQDDQEKKFLINCAFAIIEISMMMEDNTLTDKYIKEIQDLDPDNPYIINAVSMQYYIKKRHAENLIYLESKKEFLDDRSKATLALVYVKNNLPEKSIEIFKDIIESNKYGALNLVLIINIISDLAKISTEETINKMLDILKEKSNFLFLIANHEAKKSKTTNNKTTDISDLLEAEKLVSENSPYFYSTYLADAFLNCGDYKKAREWFEKFIDRTSFSADACDYATSLLKTAPMGETLEFLEGIPLSEQDTNTIAILYKCYFRIGLFKKISEMFEQNYSKLNPEMKVEKIRIRILNNDVKNIIDEINLLIKSSLTNDDIKNLANIYSYLNMKNEALELLLDRIKEGKANDVIEAGYAIRILLEQGITKINKVDINTGVIIKTQHETKEFIIEEKSYTIPFVEVYDKNYPLSKLSLGLQVGDKFTYAINDLSNPEEYTITEIVPKRILITKGILKDFDLRHPHTKAIHGIKVDLSNPIEGLNAVRKQMLEFNKVTDVILSGYDTGMLTIETFSDLMGKDIFVTYDIAQSKAIYCNINLNPPKVYSQDVFNKDNEVIIDIISLFNLFNLGLEKELLTTFKNILILTQSWLTLQNSITEASQLGKGQMWFHKDVPYPILEDRNKEIDAKKLQKLIDFKNWIEQNCKIIPCEGLKKYEEDKVDELTKKFGHCTSYSFIEASTRENIVLYADDSAARLFCLSDKNLKLTYLIPFIEYLTKNNIISQDKHFEITIDLISRKYKGLPISFRDLTYAYAKNIETFDLLTKEISKNLPMRTSIAMIYQILYGLQKSFTLPNDVQLFLDTLLQVFTQEQRNIIINQFKRELVYKEIITKEDALILNLVSKYKIN